MSPNTHARWALSTLVAWAHGQQIKEKAQWCQFQVESKEPAASHRRDEVKFHKQEPRQALRKAATKAVSV